MEGFTMNAEKGHSQSADNSQLLAHKSSPQGGHAFKLKAPYEPTGDQPQAIAELVKGFKEGNQSRLCWELPVPVRHLRWQMSSHS